MFDIPPLYDNCPLSPEECEIYRAVKVHEFNHSVYAPKSIIVTCEPVVSENIWKRNGKGWSKLTEPDGGLPEWTWHAEGYKFQYNTSEIPKYVSIIILR